MDFRRENNEIQRFTAGPSWIPRSRLEEPLKRTSQGRIRSVPTGRYLQFHLGQKTKHLGAKPWKLGFLFSTPIIWRSNRVSNRVSQKPRCDVSHHQSPNVSHLPEVAKRWSVAQKKWIKNTQLFEVEMFNEHNEHNEPFIHIYIMYTKTCYISRKHLGVLLCVCAAARGTGVFELQKKLVNGKRWFNNIVTGLSYVCRITNPFPLLLNVPKILKTRVHLPVWKISGWPIWLLIDPL